MTDTVLDCLVGALADSLQFNAGVHDAPVALLWPDEARQWESVIDRLGQHVPLVSRSSEAFDAAARRGPAYWVRCVVARTIDVGLPAGTPVVYLPGVGRSALRAVESCPAALAPIAELQYRSQWFSHPNNRDWSVRALLSHPERGLGLQVADDAETAAALALALGHLLDQRVDRLATQVLDADYFRDLVNPDPMRSLLGWLDDPQGYPARLDPAQWTALVQQCKADYGFDPMRDGEVSAARRLGEAKGAWAHVWKRFADTPERYPGIVDQLRRARPDELIVENVAAWPQDNEMAEDQLRSSLRSFVALTVEGARKKVALLEADHAGRRRTVWADLDQAPLAFALEQLVLLADLTTHPLPDTSLADLVEAYGDRGWRADDAVLRALAAIQTTPDQDAVFAAVVALYRAWLDAGARALQAAVGPMANAKTYEPGPQAVAAPGVVTVFVDGLRLDLAHRVQARLASASLDVTATTSLAALPTVTQTSKPALVPAPTGALTAGPELHAANAATGTKASIQVLRALMADNHVQVLSGTEQGDPTGTAWAEAGEVDSRGHSLGARLVDYLDEEVDRIAGRIRALLDRGWHRVDVVTDHGWLLLPGGLEKVELPPAATVIKKGRCARLKDGAVVDAPTVPWYWDQDVRIALAPGVTCFESNKEYEHGGVSPQECIVPRLSVTAGAEPAKAGGPAITKIKWLGLQCRIEFSGVTDRVLVDIRGLPREPKSSIAEQAKETSTAGKMSLLVADDEHEGERAHLVLVAPDGRILAQREVVVGRNR